MSTIKATNYQHPSAGSPAIVLDADGGATVAGMGLVLVSPTSIANSGGSASASGGEVSFTSVTSISLNGVFSSTYENYRIVYNSVGSVAHGALIRLRTAGSDNTTTNYTNTGVFAGPSTALTKEGTSGDSSWGFAVTSTQRRSRTFDVCLPFEADRTFMNGINVESGDAAANIYIGANVFQGTTSFDGITFLTNSANTMTGTIRVYGYKNS